MAAVILPFDNLGELPGGHEDLYECGLYKLLPEPIQEACQTNIQLLEYLHLVPLDDTGIPEYYPEATRKLGDLKSPNLIYPVSDDVHIHVLSIGEERDLYIPIEPTMGIDVSAKVREVEVQLLELAYLFADAVTEEERAEGLDSALRSVIEIVQDAVPPRDPDAKEKSSIFGKKKAPKVQVTQREFDAVHYAIMRDKIGMGPLQPFIYDPWIEDISCSGLGPIFVEHKIFKGMVSAINFEEHDDLDEFVLRLSEAIRRPVTIRNPIVDATLEDGSRINIVYGREVSQRGSNFTIRKAPGIPLSVIELCSFGSLSFQMAAYMSMVLGMGMNAFICGETASGKTTLINALTTFVPPDAKVVSIEDTPEVQVPHPNWIREVSKPTGAGADVAGVTMLDLLKAALRQRPNLIIIGEIRGEEGAIAFQAMQTGHAVMATFHAATVEKLIQRLTGNPIYVPKTYIENLNIAVIQSLVKLPNGKQGRRALSISEIVSYDPPSDSFSFVEVFRWNSATDEFDFIGDKNSFLLEERIAPMLGIPLQKKWDVYNIVEKRTRVLKKLHERGVSGYYELLKVIAKAQHEGIF